jgi:hypothetical protein
VISTIRFQEVVQFIQVVYLQSADGLELGDDLPHQLVLLKMGLQLGRVGTVLGAEVLGHHLVYLIPLVYLPCYLAHHRVVGLNVVQLSAVLCELVLVVGTERHIFFVSEAALVVPLFVGDVGGGEGLPKTAGLLVVVEGRAHLPQIFEPASIKFIEGGLTGVLVGEAQLRPIASEGILGGFGVCRCFGVVLREGSETVVLFQGGLLAARKAAFVFLELVVVLAEREILALCFLTAPHRNY